MNPSESNINIENLNNFIEPGFYLGLNKGSKLPVGIDKTHTFNSFEYRLKQNPNDLSCHLQRIQFCILNKNRNALFASICDLFIILGSQGLALRQRLLDTYRSVLTRDQIALISTHLTERGLRDNNESLSLDCFFKKDRTELLEPGEVSISEAKDDENILNIAESYIENSQFDTALEYMQKHLKHGKKSKALTLKLISLYKALNYTDKFHSAYDEFSSNVATSLYWNDAKQYFLNR